jgi:apolipoprotein N-acyltransferase
MVRTANTGISAIIDPYGRIVAQTRIGERKALDGIVEFRTDRTFYTRYGDVFGYSNAAAALLAAAAFAFRRGGTVRWPIQ